MKSKVCGPGLSKGGCGPKGRSRCAPAIGNGRGDGLKSLVEDYRRECAPRLNQEVKCFRDMISLEETVHHVAFARDKQWRCFDHQFRIRRTVAPTAEPRLMQSAENIRACKSFDKLHSRLNSLLINIFGVNEMYVYDAAKRIGAFLELTARKVYLHAGVRKGVMALGLNVKGRSSVEIDELPRALRVLSPNHLENFLCSYRGHFRPGME